MVDRSFLLINFRSICSLIYARTFWDTLYKGKQTVVRHQFTRYVTLPWINLGSCSVNWDRVPSSRSSSIPKGKPDIDSSRCTFGLQQTSIEIVSESNTTQILYHKNKHIKVKAFPWCKIEVASSNVKEVGVIVGAKDARVLFLRKTRRVSMGRGAPFSTSITQSVTANRSWNCHSEFSLSLGACALCIYWKPQSYEAPNQSEMH